MKQYAGTLIVCGCLGALAAVGAGCDSGSDNGSAGAPGTAGAPGAAGTPAGSTAGATPGTAGAPATAGTTGAGTAGAPPSGAGTVALMPDSGGFVQSSIGITGAWYGYGDGQGTDGTVKNSDCVLKGGHTEDQCSVITAPMFGMFPQTTPGTMCTAGTVAKVITTTMGCAIVPPATTPPAMCTDYSNLFGAGIGLDLNNLGSDGGMGKQPFNATAAPIYGFSFDIDMVPLAGIRVEFPTVGTENTAAMWKPGTNNLSPLVVGHNILLFSDVASPTYVTPKVAAGSFDPMALLSVQFHVPTTTTASAMYSFCISNFAACTTPTCM